MLRSDSNMDALLSTFFTMSTEQKLLMLSTTALDMLKHHDEDHKREDPKFVCDGLRMTANHLIPLLMSLIDPNLTPAKLRGEVAKIIMKEMGEMDEALKEAKDIIKGDGDEKGN
jgi:hypothetical protein